MRGRARWGLLLALLWLTGASPLLAADAPPEGWAYDLPHQLMSPYCPGRTLAECPSPQAESLRAWLVVQEAAGRSRADVEAELVERFGEEVLPTPPARGFGLAAHALPWVAIGAGGVLVAFFLRRLTRAAPRAGAEPAARVSDPELERIVDEEISR